PVMVASLACAPRRLACLGPRRTKRKLRASLSKSSCSGPSGAPLQSVPGPAAPCARCRAVRTARPWRGIIPPLHEDGHMAGHIRRRKFLATFGGAVAAWPLMVRAQQPAMRAAPARVGLLTVSPPTAPMLNAFREGMREHGYVEGQNLSVDVRWPRGSTEEISALAINLANANLDVIVAWATPSVLALQRATSTVPIVMVSVGDPLGSGFVASLARPGANITGLSNVTADLSGKLLDLFSELVPNLKRVGIVSNSYNPNVAVQLRQTEEAARSLGLRPRIVDTSAAEDFERAFARLSAEGVDGVVLLADPLVLGHAQRIAELAQAARLPFRAVRTSRRVGPRRIGASSSPPVARRRLTSYGVFTAAGHPAHRLRN